MKCIKLITFLVFLICPFILFSQNITFYMDSLTLERGSEKIAHNRINSPVHLLSNETSKAIYLGALGADSAYIYLRQGLIRFNSKPVPVILYSFVIKDKYNYTIDSISSLYVQFHPRFATSSRTAFGEFKLYFMLKGDSATYKLLPDLPYSANRYKIIHSLTNVAIDNRSYKNPPVTVSDNIKANEPTEKIVIGAYKKKQLFYSVSIHPINSFPELKIVCVNFANFDSYHSNTWLMKGNESLSGEYDRARFYFRTKRNSKKANCLTAQPIYLITQEKVAK